jgi:lysophospholipase L1-like esterase
MEDWLGDYNEVRPQTAIANKAPISLLNGSWVTRGHEPNPGNSEIPAQAL